MLKQSLRPWALGFGVAVMGIAASVFLARQQSESIEQLEKVRFVHATDSVAEALGRRIDAYVEIAFGLRGLFIVNPTLDRRSFFEAVTSLEVDTRYPGIKNIAFTRYVSAKDKNGFESRVRADTTMDPRGYPGFAIHPAGERNEYFVADYLWPETTPQSIHGLDISAQPANLASMLYSKHSGKPVVSAPFNLLQETSNRTGFVLRVPVFQRPKSASLGLQDANFLGSVSVTVRVLDMFQQLEREGHLQGMRLTASDLGSFVAPPGAATNAALYSSLPGDVIPDRMLSRKLDVYGRKWRLDFRTDKPFVSDTERRAPLLVGLAGGLISLLLGIMVSLLARGRMLALAQVQESGQALRDSQQRWKFAIEESGDGLWDWSIPSNTVYFSPQWKNLLDYSGVESLNQPDALVERIHPDDQAEAIARRQAHIDGFTPLYVSEYRVPDEHGTWKWILDRGVVVTRDDNGKPLRMIGTVRDTSRRKQIEEDLKQQNGLLSSIIDNFPGGISVMSRDLQLLAHNDLFAEILDFPKSLFGVPHVGLEDFVRFNVARGEYGPGDPEQQVSAALALAKKFEAHKFERVRPNGRALEVSGVPLPQGGFVSIYIDITERRHAEEQLRIAAAAFESQEGMMVTDANQVILRVNRAFTDITGYSAEEAVGQKPSLLRSGRHGGDFYRSMWDSIHRTGGWQGEIWDRHKNGDLFPKWLTISEVKSDDGTATHYIGTQYDITDRKQAEKRIEELAFFDSLTHLPNRTLLLDRLAQSMAFGHRNGTFGAVLFIDLDNFKMLNDTLGHHKGDLLLQQVASRLTASVREGDTVARLGGDEFVIVLGNLNRVVEEAASQTEVVASKVLNALRQAYELSDTNHRSTASIGATLFRGHETSIEELLKQADLAMYKSKNSGRNALRFFDPSMQIAVLERSALEGDLRKAVEAKQFVLHYQAQVEQAGQVTGCESLVRWQHPVRGMVSPAEFIPLAEECGLILLLGQWVLETACKQLAMWAKRVDMSHLTMAVNVSAQQFRQIDFVEQVLAVLHNTGANPHRLKLELTESLLVDNVQEIIGKMVALKAKGVSFSLDDFGTGYSSLSYLKRFPLDQLKIDQSFVRDVLTDPNDAAIAKTIVALAQILGLEVIAEGVETLEQRDFLAAHGCHAYQGYYFSRPLPIEGFEALCKGNRPCPNIPDSQLPRDLEVV